jgi:hypothetical protein
VIVVGRDYKNRNFLKNLIKNFEIIKKNIQKCMRPPTPMQKKIFVYKIRVMASEGNEGQLLLFTLFLQLKLIYRAVFLC